MFCIWVQLYWAVDFIPYSLLLITPRQKIGVPNVSSYLEFKSAHKILLMLICLSIICIYQRIKTNLNKFISWITSFFFILKLMIIKAFYKIFEFYFEPQLEMCLIADEHSRYNRFHDKKCYSYSVGIPHSNIGCNRCQSQ